MSSTTEFPTLPNSEEMQIDNVDTSNLPPSSQSSFTSHSKPRTDSCFDHFSLLSSNSMVCRKCLHTKCQEWDCGPL